MRPGQVGSSERGDPAAVFRGMPHVTRIVAALQRRRTGFYVADSKQLQRSAATLLAELIHLALARSFVYAPSEQSRAMSKTFAAHMIEGDFDHELRVERLPFHRAARAPAARSARSMAGKSGRFDEL